MEVAWLRTPPALKTPQTLLLPSRLLVRTLVWAMPKRWFIKGATGGTPQLTLPLQNLVTLATVAGLTLLRSFCREVHLTITVLRGMPLACLFMFNRE